jgi:TolB-like protein
VAHSKDFWSTLKERNVVRVAAVYLGTAWFVVEVAKNLSEIFGAPPWVPRAVVGFLALGLPVTLAFSWIYETTPQQSRTSARRLDRLIAIVLALIVVALLANRLVPGPSAGGLGPLSGKQFAIYCGSIAVGLAVLLGGLLILTRRHGKQAKDEVQPVPSLAAAGAIDPTATVPRIAILPFANVSGDTAQDYFCDGITENIITRLSRFRDLFVISSNSSFTYKNKSVTTQDVSRELGVTHVLQGSVQRSADRIRITVQLVLMAPRVAICGPNAMTAALTRCSPSKTK